MTICKILGEFRLQHRGCFVGTDHPGADFDLHLADDALEQDGFARDSLGYVFSTRSEATIAARLALQAIDAFQH